MGDRVVVALLTRLATVLARWIVVRHMDKLAVPVVDDFDVTSLAVHLASCLELTLLCPVSQIEYETV
jgi:hypothetical protein